MGNYAGFFYVCDFLTHTGDIMTDQTAVADVTGDITDTQVEQFFEKGGNVDLQAETKQEASVENEAQQKTEQTEQKVDQQQDAQNADKKVNYGALHEERERRKELQRQLQEQQQRTQKLEQTFQKLIERVQPPQQQQHEPSFDEDPIEALRVQNEKLARSVQEQNQTLAEQRAYAERVRQFEEFRNRYAESAQAFAKDQPDFGSAYHHLVKSRLDEYTHAGYTRKEAEQLLIEDEAAIVAKAYRDGVNPAERIYSLAKIRGYQAAAKNQPASVDKLEESVQKLEQLQKGLQASKSLSGGGGKAQAPLTLEAVANMDDEEFEKIDWNKLMKTG
jgi:chemotaxis protein histidine kinase CheA